VLLVQGYNTTSFETLGKQSLSVNDTVSETDIDKVHESSAQDYAGSNFESVFSEIKGNTERSNNINSNSSDTYSNETNSTKSIPLQNPPESPAKGYWKQTGEYWNPVFEEMVPIYEWCID
jgi:hypothetical protein